MENTYSVASLFYSLITGSRNIQTMVCRWFMQICTLAKAPSPQRNNHEMILFHAIKTIHFTFAFLAPCKKKYYKSTGKAGLDYAKSDKTVR
jgi:hypothetical protein